LFDIQIQSPQSNTLPQHVFFASVPLPSQSNSVRVWIATDYFVLNRHVSGRDPRHGIFLRTFFSRLLEILESRAEPEAKVATYPNGCLAISRFRFAALGPHNDVSLRFFR